MVAREDRGIELRLHRRRTLLRSSARFSSWRIPQVCLRPARRGFTLLEMLIVICTIAVLVVFALHRLLGLRVEAERVAMEEVLGALRAGVAMQAVSLIAQHRDGALARLHESNPMDSLAQVPSNYLGELDAADATWVPAGRWYFDRAEGLLVYRVRYAEYFETELANPPRARFRVELVYRDRNADGRFDPGIDGFHGVQVRAVEPYRWRSASTQAADFKKYDEGVTQKRRGRVARRDETRRSAFRISRRANLISPSRKVRFRLTVRILHADPSCIWPS